MEALTLSPDYVEKSNKAFKVLKESLDSVKSESHENKVAVDKAQEELDKLEEVGQKFMKEQASQKKEQEEQKELFEALKAEDQEKILEQKERIDALELHHAEGMATDSKKYKETDEYKAFADIYIKGSMDTFNALPAETKQLMRTDSNVAGGVLVPVELDNILRKTIVEVSDIRSISRVRSIAGKTLEIPIRTKNLVATYEGEAETDEDDISNFDNVTVTPFRQSVTVGYTDDLLMDSQFNIENEIRDDVGIAFAQGEGKAFVTGSGVKQPEGFLQNAAIIVGALAGISGGGAVIHADDILKLTGQLKIGYDPTFVLNRRTLATIRTLKGEGPAGSGTKTYGNAQYIWAPALNGAVAPTLAGDPYLIANDMPDIAVDAFALAYGDFRRGYEIFDRTGTMMIRDMFTKKKQAIIEVTFKRWNTGRVILAEAITMLKIASS